MSATVVAAVADLHIPSTVGLSPLTLPIDDGPTVRASKVQRWLWQCWVDYWEQVAAAKKANKARCYLVLNGDLFEGDHHGSTQVATKNKADWVRAANMVMEKSLEIADRAFFVRGTEAHDGKSADLMELYAGTIETAVIDEESKTASWWQLLFKASGVEFDVSHHGPLGRLVHTRPNALNRVALEVMDEARQMGRRPPDVVLQAHNHRCADSGRNYDTRVVAMPAWQLKTAHIHKISRSRLADIGGLIFTCEDGQHSMKKIIYRPKARRPWSE